MEKSLKEILQSLIEEQHWKPKLYKHQLREVWGKLMGATIAQYTRNLVLQKNILYITIDSPALRTELHYSKTKIMEMLNQEIGEDYIREVVIK